MTREEICHTLRNIVSQEIMHAEYMAIDAACKELKSGYWETDEEGDWHCSVCKAIIEKDEQSRHYYKYCYHCGAKMKRGR